MYCIFFYLQGVYEKWCTVLDAVPQRDASLEEELQKQQNNEQLRVDFAEKANELGAYIESRSAALADLSMSGSQGSTMEDQREALKTFQAETLQQQPILDAAEAANQVELCFFIVSS